MSRNMLLGLAVASLGAALPAHAADVAVMTQNQYIGTDILALVTEPDFNAAVIDALKTRAASLPAERVAALAALIDKRNPALVGLQEVWHFTCVDFTPGDTTGCENQEIAGAFTDQLADTLAALSGRYEEAAKVINLNLPAALVPSIPALTGVPGIPITYDGQPIFVGVMDRDVILARDDVTTSVVPFGALCPFPSADGCNYQLVAPAALSIMGIPVELRIERGFVGVDAMVDAKPYRFVVTHLETRLESSGPQARTYQSAQAAELIGTMQYMQSINPQPTTLVVGDFNSDPRDPVYPVPPGFPAYLGVPAYMQMTGSGFVDAWTLRPGTATAAGAPLVGFSCCQDEDLGNHSSDLYERVDLIFSSTQPAKVKDARLLGESVADKTPPAGFGVWPSDHASVAATLQFGE